LFNSSTSQPTLLLATSNLGKIGELTAILKPLSLRLLTLADWPAKIPEPEETGEDFLANALIKAQYYAKVCGYPALADDSGLMVEALGGRPGVASARYGGGGTDGSRKLKLLREMVGLKNRRAKFKSVLVLAGSGAEYLTWSGELAGEIAEKPLGEGGFGYDPLFWEPISGKTLAQLTLEEKNRISHRAKAGQAMARDFEAVRKFLAGCQES
jgi:XTP/dITP diphosphohydrolase